MHFNLSAYIIHEIGQRENQEDWLFPSFFEGGSPGDLFILCDGMGGHAAGEIASKTVCEAMSKYVAGHTLSDGVFGENDLRGALEAAYLALDEADTGDDKKMGTTLTFVKFHSGGCYIAHIGDSRIYHIRPSAHRILYVTHDHSLVNDLLDIGEITPEEAKYSRQKNVITRAMQPHQLKRTMADSINLTDFRDGDYIFMCSDGMLEQMEDDELVNILSLNESDARKVEILIGATKGNKDNHSAHLIKVDSISNTHPHINPIDVEPSPAIRKRKMMSPIVRLSFVILVLFLSIIILVKYLL